jgi:integrase
VRNVAELQRLGRSGPREEVQIVSKAQIGDLVAKLKGRALYTKVAIALFCGLRRGELLGLQWRDVDFDTKTLRVERALEQVGAVVKIKQPKTAAGKRIISLPDIACDALREHRREQLELRLKLGLGKLDAEAFMFANLDGSPHRPASLTNQWRETARAIGMPDITWHSLRHSHASMLISAGMDVVQISKRLGHSSPNVTLGTYAHMFKKTDTAAAVINAALAKLR